MHWIVSGLIGFFIGGFIGVSAMSICAASGAAAHKEEGWNV